MLSSLHDLWFVFQKVKGHRAEPDAVLTEVAVHSKRCHGDKHDMYR